VATGGVLPWIEAGDAESILKFVSSKVTKTASEREAKEAKAAAVEEAKNRRVGAARAAKRATIAARPVMIHRTVDNTGRVHRW
jgi:RecJ-like exonuclease